MLYQNELPYDPPTQADWTTPDGTLGWAAYKVTDKVETHHLWGGGAYVYNRNNPDIVTEHGFEVPRTAGVRNSPRPDGEPRRRHDPARGQRGRLPGGHTNTGTPSYVSSTRP